MKLGLGLFAATMLAAASSAATAMPIAPAPQVSNVEQVRTVCDAWGRCFWRPNYYYYGGPHYYAPRYYGPRYYGGYGGYGRWGHRW